jgi:hypothetical protein
MKTVAFRKSKRLTIKSRTPIGKVSMEFVKIRDTRDPQFLKCMDDSLRDLQDLNLMRIASAVFCYLNIDTIVDVDLNPVAIPLVLRHNDGTPIFVGASFLSVDDLGVDSPRLARKKAFRDTVDVANLSLSVPLDAAGRQFHTLLWTAEEKLELSVRVGFRRPEQDPFWPRDNTITVTADDIRVAVARRKNRPRGNRFILPDVEEVRSAIESFREREIPRGLAIHHIDGDPSNNSPDNLQLVNQI